MVTSFGIAHKTPGTNFRARAEEKNLTAITLLIKLSYKAKLKLIRSLLNKKNPNWNRSYAVYLTQTSKQIAINVMTTACLQVVVYLPYIYTVTSNLYHNKQIISYMPYIILNIQMANRTTHKYKMLIGCSKLITLLR